jgi:hypothetical protein
VKRVCDCCTRFSLEKQLIELSHQYYKDEAKRLKKELDLVNRRLLPQICVRYRVEQYKSAVLGRKGILQRRGLNVDGVLLLLGAGFTSRLRISQSSATILVVLSSMLYTTTTTNKLAGGSICIDNPLCIRYYTTSYNHLREIPKDRDPNEAKAMADFINFKVCAIGCLFHVAQWLTSWTLMVRLAVQTVFGKWQG